jgi:hypothetical protein
MDTKKMKLNLPRRVINKTRYDSAALEELVLFAEGLYSRRSPDWRFGRRIIFVHTSRRKGATFYGTDDPALVKVDRHKKINDGFVVGVVKPTRTGRPFEGVNELELLAAMQSGKAPLTLRRQILWRLCQGMGISSDYGQRSWCAKAPPLPFYERDPDPEQIEWERQRSALIESMGQKISSLEYYRGQVESNRKSEERYRIWKRKAQEEAAVALKALLEKQQEKDEFLRLGRPD